MRHSPIHFRTDSYLTRLYRFVGCLLFILALGACSNLAIQDPRNSVTSIETTETAEPVTRSASIRQKLLNQYQQWKGTPYQYGGLSKNGVDCSGFVFLTYRDQLGISIPRTTAEQAVTGDAITDQEFQIGDLLFFRTEIKVRHVGIYVGKQQFLHASTSEGVTLSSVKNPYWKNRYWKTQRIR